MPYNTPADKLLGAWLDATAVIKNERFMHLMTFNETFVCYLLDRRILESPENPVLPLGAIQKRMNLLKSQLNKIINDLEQKGYIIRIRSTKDKRVVFVKLTESGYSAYHKEHKKILSTVNTVVDSLGADSTKNIIDCLHILTAAAASKLKEAASND